MEVKKQDYIKLIRKMKYQTILDIQEKYSLQFEEERTIWNESEIGLEKSLNPVRKVSKKEYSLKRIISLEEISTIKSITNKKEFSLHHIKPIISSPRPNLCGLEFELYFGDEQLNLLIPATNYLINSFDQSHLEDFAAIENSLQSARPGLEQIKILPNSPYGRVHIRTKEPFLNLERKLSYFGILLEIN